MENTEVIAFLMSKKEEVRKLRDELFERKAKLGEEIDDLSNRYSNVEQAISDSNKTISDLVEVIFLLKGGEEC